MDLNKSSLHFAVIDTFLKQGFAPTLGELAERFDVSVEEMRAALRALQDYHGIVLHPHNEEIWVAHPFSTVPTGFLVSSGGREWWGNCAWCSLGLAALAESPVTITTAPRLRTPTRKIEHC